MRVLSLFNGISCGRVALERAGLNVEKYVSYEIDKYANTIAQKNYPDDVYMGDVTTADFTQYKKFDLIIGGSPCTYWSIAKNNREISSNGLGFELFMHFKRALDETGAKYFLYENNYSIHKDIQSEISRVLEVQPIMINSALVSGQRRQRLYWTNIPDVTQPENKNIFLKDVLESGVINRDKSYCITATEQKGNTLIRYITKARRQLIFEPIRIGHYGKGGQAQRIFSIEGKSVTLCANGGGQGGQTGLYKIDLPDGDYIVRKLTPTECERLQTLPDGYTEGVSNSRRYKGLGNGWTVDVIAHILKNLKKVF